MLEISQASEAAPGLKRYMASSQLKPLAQLADRERLMRLC
jgi:hypothetical protein